VQLYQFKYVIEQGKGDEHRPFNKCTEDDSPLFSYTSGTTGDSKGVKLTHKNLLYSSYTLVPYAELFREDSYISYLPYPHSFEQVLSFFTIIQGSRVGYY
jgi:long-chain acyl-CoA synthetase